MPRPGEIVALCALLLLTLGVVMVHSAGMSVTSVSAEAPTADGAVTFQTIAWSRRTLFAVVAIACMLVLWRMPIRRWSARFAQTPEPRLPVVSRGELAVLAAVGLALAGLLVLVYAPGIGREFNGAERWVGWPPRPDDQRHLRGGFTMQPSEFAKWGAVFLAAWWCGRRADRLGAFFSGLVTILVVVGGLAAIVTLEDLGTGVLIVAAVGFVLLAGGVRLIHAAVFVPPAAIAFGCAAYFSPYRMQRLVTFLNPYADPQEGGYHIIQSLTAIAGGGVFGRGLGHGLQKFGYLPEDTTDFLFAIVCEELGLAGAATVCFAYVLLVSTLLGIARREPDTALRVAVVGVAATIAVQAAINLLVVTGLAPTKGIALPLMSAGGTGWILTAGALGVVMAIDRTHPKALRRLEQNRPAAPNPPAPQPSTPA